MDFVLDIGNSRIKGGLFEGKKLVNAFSIPAQPVPKEELLRYFEGKKIETALVSSVNSQVDEAIKSVLEQYKITYKFLDYKNVKLGLDVDEPEALGHDRIANAYGALVHFPINDCIVVDIGTAITVDLIAKEGRYTGGMIYSGSELCSKSLHDYTDKLPFVKAMKPESALGKTTQAHLQSGIYYGQLGAIERMIDELRSLHDSPSSVKVIATGGATKDESFADDLSEFIDLIDPHLTLIGLREILEETYKKG
ncbi:MAG: type III pantothenate kinase [Candidatus Melainabacteria bacterium]|nr:type III pantothenate kinase [Candidatus Melainabacteria bacterium]